MTTLELTYLLNEDATFLLQESGDEILLDYQVSARNVRAVMVLVRDKV